MKIFLKITLLLLITIFIITCGEELQQPVHEYTMTSPADTGARYPYIQADETGKIFLSWIMSIEEDIFALQYSAYENEQWTRPATIKVDTNFFVNWADFPSVIGSGGEAMAAHWLQKVEGGPYAYHVQVAFPGEENLRWTDALTPHLDNTPTEHGFVTMQPISKDRVLAIWLDGRETAGREDDEYSDTEKSMTLRSAEISRNGEIARSRVIDDTVCDCCQTDLVQTGDGFAAVYRDRSEEEVRDIYIALYDTTAGEWNEPVAVHNDDWVIGACPVNGPRVVAEGSRVAVAWFTMAENEPRVLLARSDDGGRTFREPVQIAGDRTMGRADLLFNNDDLYVSWMRHRGNVGDVVVTKVTSAGEVKDPLLIGLTTPSRRSGFPRMAKMEDAILLTWTQTEPLYRVRTAKVPYQAFESIEL